MIAVASNSIFRGAHAPSRAGFGALAETIFFLRLEKFAMARAPSPAREARALPRKDDSGLS